MEEKNINTEKKSFPSIYPCPVMTTLKVIGGKWKPAILWELLRQPTLRFGALKKLIPGINHKMLTQQLRELEKDGMIERKVYAQVPPKVEYLLTPRGKSLQPILHEMSVWGMDQKEL